MSIINLVIIFLLNFNLYFAQNQSVAVKSSNVGRNGYGYILPQRKISVCPSVASSKFTCEVNHVIAIDRIVFSFGENNMFGECASKKQFECIDRDYAYDYADSYCSGREYCTLVSYDLRTRTKCQFNQIVNILYTCVPTWEIIDVPVKCDICKNITITNSKETYGFLHSAWYPLLYPRVTCHSLIKNKPNHLIVMYAITGSLGLDKIKIESIDYFGNLVSREILTGNLTARLILISQYDVNVTVLPEDTYYFEQRRFLLYFYLVKNCYTDYYCQKHTTPHIPFQNTTSPSIIDPTKTTSIITTTFSTTVNASVLPPLPSKDGYKHHTKFSDAWLAAILALAYALLMLLAVCLALYCRKRRRRAREALMLANSSSLYLNKGGSQNGSQIILPTAPQISRTQSSTSMRELQRQEELRQSGRGGGGAYYLTTPLPSYPYGENHRESSFRRGFRSGPAENVGYVGYDDDDSGDVNRSSRRSEHMSYQQHQQYLAEMNQRESIRSNTRRSYSSENATASNRGVEYTRSPKMERIRVQNLDADTDFEQPPTYEYHSRAAERSAANNDQIQMTRQTMSQSFSARLYPDDGFEKEVQELSMYVDSNQNHNNSNNNPNQLGRRY